MKYIFEFQIAIRIDRRMTDGNLDPTFECAVETARDFGIELKKFMDRHPFSSDCRMIEMKKVEDKQG
jgi:hypothetical protein